MSTSVTSDEEQVATATHPEQLRAPEPDNTSFAVAVEAAHETATIAPLLSPA